MAMESNNFDDLFGQAGAIVRALRDTYREVTGEELDLESGLRNYPLLVIGLAAGVGVLGGWWIGRRNSRAVLPPPTSSPTPTPPPPPALESEGTDPLDFLERLFPVQVNKV